MPLTSLKMSLEEVKNLASSEESTSNIKKREGIITVSLHPMYAANISKGVTDELNSMSSRYSKELEGIPIAFEKVRVSPTGGLLHTSPYMYFRVQATFYVFSPEVGSLLEGTVKKKSPHHLSCLVHSLFNVSVPKPHDIQMNDWEGASLDEGDVIRIAVTNIDMSFYLPMITGYVESVVSKAVPEVTEEGDFSEDKLQHSSVDSGISGSEEEENEVTAEEKTKQGDGIQNGEFPAKDKGKKKKNKKVGETKSKGLDGDVKKKKKKKDDDGDGGKNGEMGKKEKSKKKKLKVKSNDNTLADLSLSSELSVGGFSGYDEMGSSKKKERKMLKEENVDSATIKEKIKNIKEENVDSATIKEKIKKKKEGKRKKGVTEMQFTTAHDRTEFDYPHSQFSKEVNETTGSRKSKKRKLEETPENHKKKRKLSGL